MPVLVTAVPRRRGWLLSLFWFLGGLLLLPVAVLFGLNVNDRSVPVADDLFPEGAPRRLLTIFPHPDDEVTVAGTLSLLSREPGTEVTIAHLTHGEKGPTGNLVRQEELGAVRAAEAQAAAGLLGAAEIMLDYPDGGLASVNPADLKATIRSLIQEVQPSTILTYDDQIGLYGHMDHIITARCVREVFQEESADPDFPVRRLYAITLPGCAINLGIKLSKIVRERYPKEPEKGLPAPTVAIKMASEARAKAAVVQVHRTQSRIMCDLQPLHDKIPAWLYYRIFDREYFTLMESR